MGFYKLWVQVSDKYFNRYLKGKITFKQQRIERIREIFSISGISISNEMAEERFRFYLSKYEDNWKPFDDVLPCYIKGILELYKQSDMDNLAHMGTP